MCPDSVEPETSAGHAPEGYISLDACKKNSMDNRSRSSKQEILPQLHELLVLGIRCADTEIERLDELAVRQC